MLMSNHMRVWQDGADERAETATTQSPKCSRRSRLPAQIFWNIWLLERKTPYHAMLSKKRIRYMSRSIAW